MDVHPPHQPIHSLKDFGLRLLTITIGLFIALTLETSIEANHALYTTLSDCSRTRLA